MSVTVDPTLWANKTSPVVLLSDKRDPISEVHRDNSANNATVFSDSITELLGNISQLEDEGDNQAEINEKYYEIGRQLADYTAEVIPKLSIALGDTSGLPYSKLTSFVAESALATAKSVFLCLTALVLGVLPGRGRSYTWPPFRNQVFGPEISLHFTDPYTFLHFEDGIISYLLWGWWGHSDNPLKLPEEFRQFWYDLGGLSLGIIAGYVFEVVENSDYVINRFVRDHGTSQFYKGDSKLNVFGDILALGLGYSMSKVCTAYGFWWFPILWLIASELGCALWFRDNLVLGLIQSFFPQEWIKNFQEEIVPEHLRGIMRAGYWDNKVRDTPEQFIDKIYNVNPDLMFSASSNFDHKELLVSRRYMRVLTNTLRY